MRGATRVHINSQARIFPDEGAGRTGMIQMNVGQKESVEIADAQAMNGQLFAEVGESWTMARDQPMQHNRPNEVRPRRWSGTAGPVQIERGCGCHKENSLA